MTKAIERIFKALNEEERLELHHLVEETKELGYGDDSSVDYIQNQLLFAKFGGRFYKMMDAQLAVEGIASALAYYVVHNLHMEV